MSSLNRMIVDALDARQQQQYRKGIWLRSLDGVLNGLAQVTAIGVLLWAVAGGDVPMAVMIAAGASTVYFVSRYLVAAGAMIAAYGTSYEAGVVIRNRVLRHLARLPIGTFRKLHAGKVAHTLSEDMAWVENFASYFYPVSFSERATIIILLIAVAFLHWPVALAAVVTWGLGWLVMGKLKAALERGLGFRSAGISEASRHIIEYAEGMQVIRAFGNTDAAERDYHKWVGIMRDGFRKSIWRNAPMIAVVMGLAMISVGIGALAGVLTLPAGEGAVLQVIAAVGLLTATLVPIKAMIVGGLITSLVDIGVRNVSGIEALPALPEGEITATRAGEIRFEKVGFAYEGGKQALADISFTARPGTMTAIVGRSGAGKTTLMNALLRFWDYSEGRITLDGRDIRDYTSTSYMNRFAVVFQETTLFRDTVANNIRIGRPEATLEEIVAAAKAAQIHDTIMALENGYETVVGHGGSTLSGGERQRVTIARALLKDADVVVLDEATSALDPENEHELQLAFQALARDKTVFIIAHRLSTIVNADNILLLDAGQIVAQGDHEELTTISPLYRDMWASYRAISSWKL